MNIYLIFRAYATVPFLPIYFIYIYIFKVGKFGTFVYILFLACFINYLLFIKYNSVYCFLILSLVINFFFVVIIYPLF